MSNGIYRLGISLEELRVVLGQAYSAEELRNKLLKKGLLAKVIKPREQIITSIKSVVGKPYKRGASVLLDAPEAFDCSSLVSWAAVESGFSIPRVTIDQYVFSKRVEKDELLPGDLVFANTQERIHTEGEYYSKILGKMVKEEPIRTETLEYLPGTKVPGGVDHVGLYIGDGKLIHATVKRGGVVLDDVETSQSFRNIVGFGRIIDNNEERFVIDIPPDKPDLRNKELLLNEIRKND